MRLNLVGIVGQRVELHLAGFVVRCRLHRRERDAVAAPRANMMDAVGQDRFTFLQTHLLFRPEDLLADAIRHVDVAIGRQRLHAQLARVHA